MNVWLTIIFALFVAAAVLAVLQVVLFSPEIWLIVLGALAFGLFAYRLLSTYTFVIASVDRFLKTGEVKRTELSKRTGRSEEELETIPLSAALALLLGAMAPFRYSFYLAFTVLLLITVATALLPGDDPLKDYLEAVFWGGAVTVFVVWAFENFAEAAVAELAAAEEKGG